MFCFMTTYPEIFCLVTSRREFVWIIDFTFRIRLRTVSCRPLHALNWSFRNLLQVSHVRFQLIFCSCSGWYFAHVRAGFALVTFNYCYMLEIASFLMSFLNQLFCGSNYEFMGRFNFEFQVLLLCNSMCNFMLKF